MNLEHRDVTVREGTDTDRKMKILDRIRILLPAEMNGTKLSKPAGWNAVENLLGQSQTTLMMKRAILL